jgi:hypothetical protein
MSGVDPRKVLVRSSTHNGHSEGRLDLLFSLNDHVFEGELSAIMDLGGWLRSLGLEMCEAVFRENEIDESA